MRKHKANKSLVKVEGAFDNQLLSPNKMFNIRSDSSKFEKRVIKHTYTSETNQSEKNNKRKETLFRIADELFSKNQTLMDVVHQKIYDKVIDGKEYQVISNKDLLF